MSGTFVLASGPAPMLLAWSLRIRIVKSVCKEVWRNAIHFVYTLKLVKTHTGASSQEALVMLEPYTGKLVRTVLREERGCEAPDLPGALQINNK